MSGGVVIAIDAVGARYGGAERIAVGVVSAAIRESAIREVVVFASPARKRRFSFPQSRKLRVVDIECDGGGAERIRWLSAGAEWACRDHHATHALFLGGAGWAGDSVPSTVLLQQSLPFLPEGIATLSATGRLRVTVIGKMMQWSARAASAVIVQTETMRGLVLAQLVCEAALVKVIPVGIPALPAERGSAGRVQEAGGRISLLYVGNSSAYKNLRVVGSALDSLKSRGWRADLVATIEPGEGLSKRSDVKAIGYVDEERLAELYREASCLVMPSLAETVCLPLIEAMAHSLPVVVADRPYAQEVCGPAAIYFDPYHGESLLGGVLSTVLDVAGTSRRLELGRMRARTFGSAESFERLVNSVLEAS